MRCSTMKNTMPAAPPLDAHEMRSFAANVFTRYGLKPEASAIVAESLVWADLHGIDTLS